MEWQWKCACIFNQDACYENDRVERKEISRGHSPPMPSSCTAESEDLLPSACSSRTRNNCVKGGGGAAYTAREQSSTREPRARNAFAALRGYVRRIIRRALAQVRFSPRDESDFIFRNVKHIIQGVSRGFTKRCPYIPSAHSEPLYIF